MEKFYQNYKNTLMYENRLIIMIWHFLCTSDSYSKDRRTVGSDSVSGLTVVLTALSRANLREGEDRARLCTPCCVVDTEKIHLVLHVVQVYTDWQRGAQQLTYNKHHPQVVDLRTDFFVLTSSGTTFLEY